MPTVFIRENCVCVCVFVCMCVCVCVCTFQATHMREKNLQLAVNNAYWQQEVTICINIDVNTSPLITSIFA